MKYVQNSATPHRRSATRVISCERPRDSFPELTHFYEMRTHDLLVFLEPLSVFQDKTLGEELRYLDVLCLKSRFVSISINTQRKQIAKRMADAALCSVRRCPHTRPDSQATSPESHTHTHTGAWGTPRYLRPLIER